MSRKKNPEDYTKITASNGKEIHLSEKCFYINPAIMPDRPHMYNTLQAAIADTINGTPSEPMTIYIEPNVYLMNGEKNIYGLNVNKDFIQLIGLTTKANDVVIADSRGLDIDSDTDVNFPHTGSVYISGTGFSAINITFANYCNCDIEYPSDYSKNLQLCSNTLTKASCIEAGNEKKELDRFYFRNVRFIGMLNTISLENVKRIFFEGCYVKGTNYLLNIGDTHYYKNCSFDCYGTTPIYSAGLNGTAFVNCIWNFHLKELLDLQLMKYASPLYMIDCEFKDTNNYIRSIHWAKYDSDSAIYLYHNVTKDGIQYKISPIGRCHKYSDEQLQAINSYTLLKSYDNWNIENLPIHQYDFSSAPLYVHITPSKTITTGNEPCMINAKVFPTTATQDITWKYDDTYIDVIETPSTNFLTISGKNTTDLPINVEIVATSSNGLFNKCHVVVEPKPLDSPKVLNEPSITIVDGMAVLNYQLELEGYIDDSIIDWYYLNNSESGHILAPTTVSRSNTPCTRHKLSFGDIGKYVIATIIPKHTRSIKGNMITITSPRRIVTKDIAEKGMAKFNYHTDFSNFPTDWNYNCINGGFIVDAFAPTDLPSDKIASTSESWDYLYGRNGAKHEKGLMTIGFGARILYKVKVNELKLAAHNVKFNTYFILKLNPENITGEGFSGTNKQYLEFYIKYNTDTQTGYGLRIERTNATNYATTFTLYEYTNGIGKPLHTGMYSSAFTAECTIRLSTKNDILHAHVTTSSSQSIEQKEAGLPTSVKLSAEIVENNFYGVGIQHTGDINRDSSIQLTELKVNYTNNN